MASATEPASAISSKSSDMDGSDTGHKAHWFLGFQTDTGHMVMTGVTMAYR